VRQCQESFGNAAKLSGSGIIAPTGDLNRPDISESNRSYTDELLTPDWASPKIISVKSFTNNDRER
jgi:hypothetical protein